MAKTVCLPVGYYFWLDAHSRRNHGLITPTRIYTSVLPDVNLQFAAQGLKERGVEYCGYACRAAARVLTDNEIKRVKQD